MSERFFFLHFLINCYFLGNNSTSRLLKPITKERYRIDSNTQRDPLFVIHSASLSRDKYAWYRFVYETRCDWLGWRFTGKLVLIFRSLSSFDCILWNWFFWITLFHATVATGTRLPCTQKCFLYFSIFLIFSRLFKNKDSRSRPDHLLFAEVVTMPITQCNELYLNYNRMANSILLQYGISENQYCAYDQHGRGDSCKGDSGA